MSQELKVTFEPSGRTVNVLPGTILVEAAAQAGFIIETPCGGGGKCGKCLVRIPSGACTEGGDSHATLPARLRAKGYRLACQCRVVKDVTVEIPDASLFQTGQKILSEHANDKLHLQPSIRKRFLALPPPDRDDGLSDTERLRRALGAVAIDMAVLKTLPDVMRRDGFRVTASVVGDRVVDLEPGDTSTRFYGVAFDIGTTTVVGNLVDLSNGGDLGVASTINPQTSYGDDVVSRIRKCRDEADGLATLQEAIIGAVNAILAELAGRAGVDMRHICEVVFAGNTTMQQILCGINPRSLGEIPFVPAFREPLRMRASDLGLDLKSTADVYVFPQIGGFVGGDTVAGIIATRTDQSTDPVLFVDVGTNGEIVLAHEGKLVATSVAAGPAFEGARIVNGMRATNGAIEKVVANGDVNINVIGGVRATGICGSGLIDAAATLLRTGVLDATGRIVDREELPAGVPARIAERLVKNDGQNDFILAHAVETAMGEPLRLHQRDIRELQLANAAIRAGISILLKSEGLVPADLSAILLAGGFGNFIRRSNARRIGMLPPVPTDRIRFVGNTSLFGAKRALLSSDEKAYAARVATETRHLDLSLNPEFQMEFSEAMLFPESE